MIIVDLVGLLLLILMILYIFIVKENNQVVKFEDNLTEFLIELTEQKDLQWQSDVCGDFYLVEYKGVILKLNDDYLLLDDVKYPLYNTKRLFSKYIQKQTKVYIDNPIKTLRVLTENNTIKWTCCGFYYKVIYKGVVYCTGSYSASEYFFEIDNRSVSNTVSLAKYRANYETIQNEISLLFDAIRHSN